MDASQSELLCRPLRIGGNESKELHVVLVPLDRVEVGFFKITVQKDGRSGEFGGSEANVRKTEVTGQLSPNSPFRHGVRHFQMSDHG